MCPLFLAAARAGTWNFAVTKFQYTALYNGKSTGQTYSAPPPTTNSNPISIQGPYASGGTDVTNSASVTLSFTLTGTWVPDPTLPSDPAPPSVLVAVATMAQAYGIVNGVTQIGTVNDGYGDTPDPHSGVATMTHYLPPSGTVSLSVSLLASFTGATGFAYASVGPLTFSIHAQPYNFRRVYFPGETVSVHKSPGTLMFSYKWSSTDGVLAHLSGETIHENVVAPSSPSLLLGVTQLTWAILRVHTLADERTQSLGCGLHPVPDRRPAGLHLHRGRPLRRDRFA